MGVKYILVTGAASGLGRAVAENFAAGGAHVFACDINRKALKELDRNNITTIEMDVTSKKSAEAALKTVKSRTKGLDGLVNVAGIFKGGSIVEIPEETFQLMFKINVEGTYMVTKTFFPLLLENRGRVITISSETARLSAGFNGLYSMTKYAIEAFSDALRRELMFLGMKVIIIQPGPIKTPLLAATPGQMMESKYFKNLVNKISEFSKKEEARSYSPARVAEIISQAFYTKNPKLRYRVNQPLDRYILSLLPAKLVDSIFKKVLS